MDIRKLKTILDLFENSSLAEMEFCEGEEKVRLSKFSTAAASAAAIPASPPAADAALAAASAASAEKDSLNGNEVVVKSPMVGTFYRASSPDKPPFVRVGQSVKKGDILCIVEAMKLMNEIPSPTDGVVKKMMVENDEAVAYGTPLFIIE